MESPEEVLKIECLKKDGGAMPTAVLPHGFMALFVFSILFFSTNVSPSGPVCFRPGKINFFLLYDDLFSSQ
jgi:hypothetical protein